jgi:hypothetical protein
MLYARFSAETSIQNYVNAGGNLCVCLKEEQTFDVVGKQI